MRAKNEELGLRAADVLKRERTRFSENLRQAEKIEADALVAELDALESEIRQIALQAQDTEDVVIPDRIQKRVEELAELGREKAKRWSRSESSSGYDLESRKQAMVALLMDKGSSRSEAIATVEDMVEQGILPNPSQSEAPDSAPNEYAYSQTVRQTAAIETLVQSGWERSEAVAGVENLKSEIEVTVANGNDDTGTSSNLQSEKPSTDSSKRPFSNDEPGTSSNLQSERPSIESPKSPFSSERGTVDKDLEREVEENWTPRPGGLSKEDAAWVARDIRGAKSWEELEEIIRFHDENGR